jgi:hypothetical protein
MNAASRYEAFRGAGEGSIRDELIPAGAPPEIELQARWFSGEFGRDFRTVDGRAVRIIQFGVWNREPGPDFAEAAISIDYSEPIRGAIELDLDARDWERHGHSTNAAYEQVILHLFFESGEAAAFARTLSNRAIPQVRLDLRAISDDPSAHPPLAVPGRCVAPLRELDLPALRSLLESAAQFRLQRKAAALARLREAHGGDEALYQSLARTLGYKSNKLPFSLLSQRVPIGLLRRSGKTSASRMPALLFGVAGFLKSEDFPAAAPDTKAYLRALWEQWWRLRPEWESLTIPARLWKLGGQRPVNHPQRRLAALAAIVGLWPKLRPLADACDEPKIRALLASLRDGYWSHHYTVRSEESKSPMALVGDSRVTEMLANVFYPWAILDHPEKWEAYLGLAADLPSRQLKIASTRLFSTDTRQAALLKSVPLQQGLLQIYEDFCLRDQSDCAACRFPRQISQWRK